MIQEGTIIRQVSGFYDVALNKTMIQCAARGIFRKNKLSPMVGDKVLIDVEQKIIIDVLPRKNQLKRPTVSNIDYLWVVMAVNNPMPDFMLVDKLIISAQINNVQPLVVINKIDLATLDEANFIDDTYRLAGYKTFRVSCVAQTGIEILRQSLPCGIVALAGQSGVGKSSLLNRICPELSLVVGNMSTKINRGKHTTGHVQLIFLPGGAMAVDTPGFSAIEVDDILPEQLHRHYIEFDPYIGRCRFDGCMHDHEPSCMVKEAVSAKKISSGRYERYISIFRSLKDKRRDKW